MENKEELIKKQQIIDARARNIKGTFKLGFMWFIMTAEPIKPTRGVPKNESPADTDTMDMESSKKNNLSGNFFVEAH
ncbi:hypothetical protein Tco_0808552 [Tanacetum coccineum]